MLLSSDVGGTKSNFALFDSGDPQTPLFEKTFATSEASSLLGMIEAFLDEAPARPTHACLAVAGAIADGKVRASVLPWTIDAEDIRRRFDIHQVELLNDVVAGAYGCLALGEDGYEELAHGIPHRGNVAVMAAGTYLGTALLVDHPGAAHVAVASEGSYADFAPHNTFEIEFLRFLAEDRPYVLKKEVLCGGGLERLYYFLLSRRGEDVPEWFVDAARTRPAAAVVVDSGLSGCCEVCSEALDRFADLIAAEAGSMAAILMALGGVYITGGVCPKFSNRFKTPRFRRIFTDRDTLTPVMQSIPVRLVTNEKTPLLGAASYGAKWFRGD